MNADEFKGFTSPDPRLPLRENPMVTIVTACRNAAKTIGQTILSVINQGYSDIEYIIVDSNSTDGTADIIRHFEQNISLWIQESDDGIADGWNKGIRYASGEIIGIINADDYYMPGTIATVIDAFRTNPDRGFVFGDLEVVNEQSGKRHVEKGRDTYESTLPYEMSVRHPTMFVRSETYRRLGSFDGRYRLAMDHEFLCRMTSRGIKGRYIPRTLSVMRQGGLSDVNRILAFSEVRAISALYGGSRTVAAAYFWFKVARTHLGRMVDRLGIDAHSRRMVRYWLIGHSRAIWQRLLPKRLARHHVGSGRPGAIR